MMKKYMNCACCALIALLLTAALEITPQAYELLSKSNKTGEAWISDVLYT